MKKWKKEKKSTGMEDEGERRKGNDGGKGGEAEKEKDGRGEGRR